jgi:hypothetical protein
VRTERGEIPSLGNSFGYFTHGTTDGASNPNFSLFSRTRLPSPIKRHLCALTLTCDQGADRGVHSAISE